MDLTGPPQVTQDGYIAAIEERLKAVEDELKKRPDPKPGPNPVPDDFLEKFVAL